MPRKRTAINNLDRRNPKRAKYHDIITLDQLPVDIITLICQWISSIQDYLALMCTKRQLALYVSQSIISLHDDHLQAFGCLKNMPQLTKMTCDTWWSNIDALPRQLTYLHIGDVRCLIDCSTVILPPSLTHLHIGLRDLNLGIALLDQLPMTLTYLHLETPMDTWRATQFNRLPPLLTYLAIPRCKTWLADANVTFPSQLTTLQMNELQDVSEAWIKRLPATLQALRFDGQESDMNILNELPPNLTLLDTNISGSLDEDMMAVWPRSLRILRLRQMIMPNPKALSLFHLTEITIPHICFNDQLDGEITNFSSSLSLLTVFNCLFTFNADNISLLPRTLTHLDCMSVTSNAFANLPPSLTFLQLYRLERSFDVLRGDHAYFYDLPRQLLHLNIHYESHLISDTDLMQLPPNLTFLALLKLQNMSLEAMKSLPRTLNTLLLPKNTSLNNKAMQYLPPNLTRLELKNNQKLTLAGIRALPQSLKILHIGSCSRLDNTCVAALPRQLETLCLPAHLAHHASTCLPHLSRLSRLYFHNLSAEMKAKLFES